MMSSIRQETVVAEDQEAHCRRYKAAVNVGFKRNAKLGSEQRKGLSLGLR